MRLRLFKNTVLFFVLILISCGSKSKAPTNTEAVVSEEKNDTSQLSENNVIVGANQTAVYLPLLKDKHVGIVANQTSVIFKTDGTHTHLVDSLLNSNIAVKTVFAPEHGFRGIADAGEIVKDGIDTKTGIPIVSLYGKNKKPTKEQLEALDIVVFDIQDVGARFYTYISSLHYVMEACAEQNIPLLILDRPNPNGHYIDGPILEKKHSSFVGMHPIPVVHGMTIGEYAKMINGEAWLDNNVQCAITIVKMQHYDRQKKYHLPIKPSPNLPNNRAINLYPSLCFFEGTNVSVGRGTSKQFQIYGSPYLDMSKYDFKFIPEPNEGAKYPKHDGTLCYGEDLSLVQDLQALDLNYLITSYHNSVDKSKFFNPFFTKLAGTQNLQTQIETGISEKEIKESWKAGLSLFEIQRARYLLYD